MRHFFCGATVQTGPGLPLFDFSKSQIDRYPHPTGVLLWINIQLFTAAAAYTVHTRGLKGIEPAIRTIERFRTSAIDSTVTRIVDTVFIIPDTKILTNAINRDENLTTYARWDWKLRSATKRNELNVYIQCEHENFHISDLRRLGHTLVTTGFQVSLF
jgi:hypothetical protein